MPSSYYLSAANSGLGGGADFSKELVRTGPTTGSQTFAIAAGATETSYGSAPGYDPGGRIDNFDDPLTYDIWVEFSTLNANVELSVSVSRLNEAGAVQETSSATAAQQLTGSATFQFSLTADIGPWNPGDRLRVNYHFHNTDGANAQSVEMEFGDLDYSQVSAPWYLNEWVQYEAYGSASNANSASAAVTLQAEQSGLASQANSAEAAHTLSAVASGLASNANTASGAHTMGLACSGKASQANLCAAEHTASFDCFGDAQQANQASGAQMFQLACFGVATQANRVATEHDASWSCSGNAQQANLASAYHLFVPNGAVVYDCYGNATNACSGSSAHTLSAESSGAAQQANSAEADCTLAFACYGEASNATVTDACHLFLCARLAPYRPPCGPCTAQPTQHIGSCYQHYKDAEKAVQLYVNSELSHYPDPPDEQTGPGSIDGNLYVAKIEAPTTQDFSSCHKKGWKAIRGKKCWHGTLPWSYCAGNLVQGDPPSVGDPDPLTVTYLERHGYGFAGIDGTEAELEWRGNVDRYSAHITQTQYSWAYTAGDGTLPGASEDGAKSFLTWLTGCVAVRTAREYYDYTGEEPVLRWADCDDENEGVIVTLPRAEVSGIVFAAYSGSKADVEDFLRLEYCGSEGSCNITISDTQIHIAMSASEDSGYPGMTVSVDCDLASAYTLEMFLSDFGALQTASLAGNTWDLRDDIQYPWRTDRNCPLVPYVRYDEPYDYVEAPGPLPADYETGGGDPSTHTGEIIGGPLPHGYGIHYQFRDGLGWNPGLGLPASATVWNNDWHLDESDAVVGDEFSNTYPGAWMKFDGTHRVMEAQAWAGTQKVHPSFNYFRPCGADRDIVDERDAIYLAEYGAGDYDTYCKVKLAEDPGHPELLLYPDAWPICGRVEIVSATQNGSDVDVVLEGDGAPYLRVDDAVDFVTYESAISEHFVATAIVLSVTDATHFTYTGTANAATHVKSHDAPHYMWDDSRPKGDFIFLEWLWDVDASTTVRTCTQACLPRNGCCPSVMCIAATAPEWCNGVTLLFPRPSGFAANKTYLWQAVALSYLPDPVDYYQTHDDCEGDPDHTVTNPSHVNVEARCARPCGAPMPPADMLNSVLYPPLARYCFSADEDYTA